MKKIIIAILSLGAAIILLPAVIVFYMGGVYRPPTTDDDTISVYIKAEDKVVDMRVGEYLVGVVSAEMPADFEMEALKAQAVAARSYLYARMADYKKNGTPEEHKGAQTCTDPSHCKAWISEKARKDAWDADKRESNWKKITSAVEDTKGVVMRYGGEYVKAFFHSTSSGKTERSADVWGGDLPYLQSVDSPGDLQSPKYAGEVWMSVDEFKQKAADNVSGVNWDSGIVGDIQRSGAGGIITIVIGSVQIKGTQFRTIYDLKSTNAEIEVTDSSVHITTKGYGHGVGMSQYGANYFAQQGMNYEQILKTYYTGVEVQH